MTFFYFTREIGKNLAENLERIFFSEGRLKKILGNFFWGGERLRLVFLASRSLSLALASKVASSTPPL